MRAAPKLTLLLCLALFFGVLPAPARVVVQTPSNAPAPKSSAVRTQTRPELVVQAGHSHAVEAVVFSPDGRTLASGGLDATLKLWEVETGRELRTLVTPGNVLSIAFSADAKIVAAACFVYGPSPNVVMLWDVETGRELHRLEADFKNTAFDTMRLAFSPDARLLAVGGLNHTEGNINKSDGRVQVWDLGSGRLVRDSLPHQRSVDALAFSPDGRLLATVGPVAFFNQGYLYECVLWNAATGERVRALDGRLGTPAFDFSPDGQRIAGAAESRNAVKLWDVSTGKDERTFEGGMTKIVAVRFSRDGRELAWASPDGILKLQDLVGRGVKDAKLGVSKYGADVVTLSPDLRRAASAKENSTDFNDPQSRLTLWDADTGARLHDLSGRDVALHAVVYSHDGRLVATAGTDKLIRIWSAESGTPAHTIPGHTQMVRSVALSPDDRVLVSGGNDGYLAFWDTSSGELLRAVEMPERIYAHIGSVAFSPDGRLLAHEVWRPDEAERRVQVREAATGKLLREVAGQGKIAFSPDGSLLAGVVAGEKAVVIWRVADLTRVRAFTGFKYEPGNVVFSPDGRLIAAGGRALDDEHYTRIWDASNGAQVHAFKGTTARPAFNRDGSLLAIGGANTAAIWDTRTWREVRRLTGHTGSVSVETFSPDGQLVAASGEDATARFFDASTGEQTATLITYNESDWVVAAADGLFDGTPAAWNRILWRFNNNTREVAPVEQFFSEFYYPGLLGEILRGSRPRAPEDITTKDRRQPVVKITRADTTSVGEISARTIKVRVELSDAAAGARDVRLFRNGSLVKFWRGEIELRDASAVLEASVPIVAGENRLTAYAFNRDNIKSEDAVLTVRGAETLRRKGVVHVIAVGINVYANPQYNLRYAVADARAFADEIKSRQASLDTYARVEITTLFDAEATRANILAALERLAAKTQPEDLTVVYFAGHGIARGARFYLIPHDLGYAGPRTASDEAVAKIAAHGVSDRQLEDAFEKIDSGQTLFVIDACNSGQALESEERRRGPMNSKGLAQLAYEKGLYVLTAAQSYQAALEASELGHGLLTFALVEEGLRKGAADRRPADGEVWLREWLDFAAELVPQMQIREMKECRDAARECAVVEGESAIKDVEKRSLQRPRIFYKREPEQKPLVIARTKASSVQE